MKKSIKVELDDKTIEVTKLPLGKYAEFLGAIKELPKHLEGVENQSVDQILQKLPLILSESLPDAVRLICIITDLKKEEVEALGLDEVSRIVVAFIEVNNYREVYDNVKKALAQPAKQQQLKT